MTTAAIYVRVSTPGQAEDGFGASEGETNPHYQLRECQELAAHFGLTVPPDYVVTEQASGAYIERDGLDRVRGLIREKRIEALVMWKTDRIARDEDLVGQLLVLNEAKRAGVVVYTSTTGGPVDTTMQGNLVNVINAYVAASEKDAFRLRSMSGKRGKARNENVLPIGTGKGIFGYDYVRRVKRNKQTGDAGSQPARVINEAESQIVRRMFGMALEGLGVNTIARMLNADGARGKTGAQWHPRTVKNTLMNPAYTGLTAYGREVTKLLAHGKVERHKRDESEVIIIEGFTPSIIDRATFDRVQNHLARPRQSGHALTPYMLSGMLRCSCGVGMTGQALTKGRYHYYRCRATGATATRPKTCATGYKRMEAIDSRVWYAVTHILGDPDRLTALAQRHLDQQADAVGPAAASGTADDVIARLDAELADIMLAMRSATDPATMVRLSKRLERIETEKRRARRTRKAKDAPQRGEAVSTADRDAINSLVAMAKDRLRTEDTEDRHKLLAILGFEATLNGDNSLDAMIRLSTMAESLGSDNEHAHVPAMVTTR